ncbi:aldehyde dehydrogenase family protein [Spelaeicoccus albus]|uniref:Aldehyde dehydrogenase (NAD+)/betaine-aldehyde dehydrogenase n=1 Tax=Spelaeicoccus albus TaxID=1280376 RepID=A0A7Z0CZC1_9MICO|nr:aldehyde dehydrogenase family protein [Spelaeicoccus albus]NYI66129.1 aldehyde dehydrogenase (NAD+)/betaine-aldehyde dehydrogenase [Spelaeicoccus albus]
MHITQSFIDGRSVRSADTFENIDPATGTALGLVARGGADEVEGAVAAARAAQPGWAATPPERRADLLESMSAVVLKHRDELARLECEDTGKPLTQAYADVDVAARYFRYYGRGIESYYGRTIPLGDGMHVYTRREPFGVTGHVVAWNYPLQLMSRAVATSLATGNAAVVKPADETPRTAVRVAELLIEAGFPAGVLNVVTGLGGEAGAALSAHPDVDHLGFVGSTAVGSLIAHAAADRVVPTVLELGGKSANVVFADADVDAAVPFLVKSILQNAGQTCSAGSRLLVHEDVRDEVLSKVAGEFRKVSIGPGIDDPALGPLVSTKQLGRVRGFVDSLDRGTVVTGGRTPDDLAGGAFYAPTLIDGVDPQSEIAREEVFGPVVVSMSFADDDEAVALANGTDYALLAAAWTTNLSRAHRMAREFSAGQVFVNTYGAGGGVELPFGGFKKSGYGREKGIEAFDAYTQTKTVVMKL